MKKLLKGVLAVSAVIIGYFILHIEGLGHIQAIQPDLVWIDHLVPEVACCGSWLPFQLAVYRVDGFAVLLPSGKLIEIEKGFSGIYIVQVILVWIIGSDGAVLLHKVVDKGVGKFQVFFIFGNMVQFKNGLDHTAIDIVPGRRRSVFDLFNIPDRSLGGAFFQQLVNVIV